MTNHTTTKINIKVSYMLLKQVEEKVMGRCTILKQYSGGKNKKERNGTEGANKCSSWYN